MSVYDSSYWFELAEYDLDSARVMHEGRKYLYVGYMCHQSVEKTLKGVFVKRNNSTPPYTHKLMLLIEKCNLQNEFTEKDFGLIDELEPLQIEARYPSYKDKLFKTLTERYCRELVARTGELISWLRKI